MISKSSKPFLSPPSFFSISISSLFTLSPVCAPWHSFQPWSAGSIDVRPGLIDRAINFPCIAFAACPASCLIERKNRGRNGQSRWEERVSGKLLIKYKSIVCHLSGQASTSPLRENMERWRGGSIRRTSGRDKCLIHQSNYIMAIKETSGLCEVGGSMLQHLFRPLLLFEMISRPR